MSSYYYVCPHATVCILIRLHMCPHTAICVSSYGYTCVLILLYMCPHTAIHVSSYYFILVLILLHMCPHSPIRVLILLHMCPHTAIHVSSYYCVLHSSCMCCIRTYYVAVAQRALRPSCIRYIVLLCNICSCIRNICSSCVAAAYVT
jgi:hypothetical protein